MKIKFFKEPAPKYSDLGFLECCYYAIVCPMYIGVTGIFTFLSMFVNLRATLIGGIVFLLFLRNLPQIEKMYEQNY